jgi:predicted nucleotidyltransferase
MTVPQILMTGKEILKILQEEKQYLRDRYGLLTIGLFGSYANDSPRPESDIDLLVELSEPRFDFLAGLQIYLERRLGKPVELIRKRTGMSDRFLRRIEKDIHYA